MLAKDVADCALQRAGDPRPDGPLVPQRCYRCASVYETPGEEPGHRGGECARGRYIAPNRDKLRKGDGTRTERVGEHCHRRKTEDASVSVHVPETAGARRGMDPPRCWRLTHVVSLLGLRLEAHSRALGRIRAPRVERHEEIVVLGRVAARESLRQREDTCRYVLEDARIVSVVAIAERDGAHPDSCIDLAGAPDREIEEHTDVELVLAVTTLSGLERARTSAVENVVRTTHAHDLQLDA